MAVVMANDSTRSEWVEFKKGMNSAVVEGKIKGYEKVGYILSARANQYMNVSLASKHKGIYFNILEPGESKVNMFNGAANRNQFESSLRSTGDYTIRVYMNGAAPRRNETGQYRLEMVLGS
jgi:hypothetical protein